MRVDVEKFKREICTSCKKYTGQSPKFSKCPATKTNIYQCARRLIFDRSWGR